MHFSTKVFISVGLSAGLLSGSATPAAAAAPLQLQGSAWLGGQGVPICSSSTDPVCGGQQHVGGVSSNWWQCVEAAQRLYQRRGWWSGLFLGSNGQPVASAYQIFDGASRMGMTAVPNGSVTSVTPGDMIVMPRAGSDGHVTMVDRVTVNGDGTRTISTVGQNVSTPRLDLRWHGGTVDSPWASYTVRGVVHSPRNTGPATGPGGGTGYEDVRNGGGVHVTGPNSYTDVSSSGQVYAWNGGYFGGSPIGYHDRFTDAKVTSNGAGYWLLSAAGQVYAYGNAPYTGGSPTGYDRQVVAMAATPDNQGYVMVSHTGQVYAYGAAQFRGGSPTGWSGAFVDIEMTPDGGGYWLLTSAGQVYAYGNAAYTGGSPTGFDRAIVAMSPTRDGRGYVLVSKTGQVYAYGNAQYKGGSPAGVTGEIADVGYRTDGAHGYVLVSTSGQHYAYSTPFLGNPSGTSSMF